MKVDKKQLQKNIESILADGIIYGEEVDVTSKKIMEEVELIIRAAEKCND